MPDFWLRSSLLKEGVVGVGGNVDADNEGEDCLLRRCEAMKMPALGADVVKYRML